MTVAMEETLVATAATAVTAHPAAKGATEVLVPHLTERAGTPAMAAMAQPMEVPVVMAARVLDRVTEARQVTAGTAEVRVNPGDPVGLVAMHPAAERAEAADEAATARLIMVAPGVVAVIRVLAPVDPAETEAQVQPDTMAVHREAAGLEPHLAQPARTATLHDD